MKKLFFSVLVLGIFVTLPFGFVHAQTSSQTNSNLWQTLQSLLFQLNSLKQTAAAIYSVSPVSFDSINPVSVTGTPISSTAPVSSDEGSTVSNGCGHGPTPIGTTNQTIRCDGSNWVAAGNLLNSGINIGVNSSPSSVSGVQIKVNGGVQILPNSTSAVCNANTRGTLWFTQAGSGDADYAQLCAKGSDGSYDWYQLSMTPMAPPPPPPPQHGVALNPGFLGAPIVSDNGTPNTTSDDFGTFIINFNITAGDTVWIPLTAARSASSNPITGGVEFYVTGLDGSTVSAGNATGFLEVTNAGSGGVSTSGNYVRINQGSTAHMKLTVYYDPDTTNSYRVQLYAVNFATSMVAGTDQQLALPTSDYVTQAIRIPN